MFPARLLDVVDAVGGAVAAQVVARQAVGAHLGRPGASAPGMPASGAAAREGVPAAQAR